jgi:hypothetical protein
VLALALNLKIELKKKLDCCKNREAKEERQSLGGQTPKETDERKEKRTGSNIRNRKHRRKEERNSQKERKGSGFNRRYEPRTEKGKTKTKELES